MTGTRKGIGYFGYSGSNQIVMKKFHESKLLLHPVAAGELSFDRIVV